MYHGKTMMIFIMMMVVPQTCSGLCLMAMMQLGVHHGKLWETSSKLSYICANIDFNVIVNHVYLTEFKVPPLEKQFEGIQFLLIPSGRATW